MWTERFLEYRIDTLVQFQRLGVIALRLIDVCDVVENCRDPRAFRPDAFLEQVDSPPVQVQRLRVVFAFLLRDQSQILERHRKFRTVRAQLLFLDLERALQQGSARSYSFREL